MAGGRNEVEAAMDPGVRDDLLAHHTVLLVQVEVKLIVNVIQNWCPAMAHQHNITSIPLKFKSQN